MSEQGFKQLVDTLRPFLVGNGQVPDGYSGKLVTNLSQGSVGDVSVDAKLKKGSDVTTGR